MVCGLGKQFIQLQYCSSGMLCLCVELITTTILQTAYSQDKQTQQLALKQNETKWIETTYM